MSVVPGGGSYMPRRCTSSGPTFGMSRCAGLRTPGSPGAVISTAVIWSGSCIGGSGLEETSALFSAAPPKGKPRKGSGAAAAQDKTVLAHLVGREPLEEAHAEEVLAQHAGLRHERAHAPLVDRADGKALDRDLCRHGDAVGG